MKMLHAPPDMLTECISQTLVNVLGASPAEALQSMLGGDCADSEAFSRRLHQLLGNGALVIEILVAKTFYTRLNRAFDEHTPFDFVKCVRSAGVGTR